MELKKFRYGHSAAIKFLEIGNTNLAPLSPILYV